MKTASLRRIAPFALALGLVTPAHAITRTQVLARAKAYAMHPWTAKTANLTASCSAGYKSIYQPGDFIGLPYNWGGYQTLTDFDKRIVSGEAAGAQPTDGVLSCTAGVDCSGFVSGAWESGHFTTSSIPTVSTQIAQSDLLAGDVLNKAGYHVAMFSHLLANGDPYFIESAGYNVHVNPFGGWSYVSGYLPRRYNQIEGTSAADPQGTSSNPIPIPTFPFSDDRNTTTAMSDVFDRCPLSSSNESGPEYVYQVKFTQPGQVTVSVTDDASTDIDVHLYSSLNTNDCMARNDATFTQAVDCGTYYIVADTFVNGSGTAQAGNYHLTVSFTPAGTACGAGPHVYKTTGGPGEACGFPGHEDLPFCNPNLGADTCVYSSGASASSFCSHPCSTVADCADYAGGCCEDLGGGEKYCMPSSWCGGGSASANPNPVQSETDAGPDSPKSDGGMGNNDTDGGEVGALPPGDSGGCSFSGSAPTGAALILVVGILGLAHFRRRRTFLP